VYFAHKPLAIEPLQGGGGREENGDSGDRPDEVLLSALGVGMDCCPRLAARFA
jgi:hypothetical protein